MFLLNIAKKAIIVPANTFTIQNVPIKLYNVARGFRTTVDLQYKMFLLNTVILSLSKPGIKIYNTKCSY